MSNPHPKPKRQGQAKGWRRINGIWLDVTNTADLLGVSPGFVRSRAARGLLPHRRFGGRLVFSRAEILEMMSMLPGVTLEEAREAQQKRMTG